MEDASVSIETGSVVANNDALSASNEESNTPLMREKGVSVTIEKYGIPTANRKDTGSKCGVETDSEIAGLKTLVDGVFMCSLCGKSYKKKGCFEKHLKLHSNPKKLKSGSKIKGKTTTKNVRVKKNIIDLKPSRKLRHQKVAKRGRPRKKKDFHELSESDSDFAESKSSEEKESDDAHIVNDEGNDFDDDNDSHNDDKEDNQKLQCQVCNRRFTTHEKLKSHMNVHEGERPFPCTICNKRFIRRDHLKAHVKRHSNPVRFSCDVCGESFKREDHLKYHKINNHGGTIFLNQLKVFNKTERKNLEKTVLCELCGKGFVDQNRLKIHMKIHTDSKRYECKYCHRSFSNSSNFNVHVRLHTGKNPYKCVVCGECFRTSSKLKTHTRKHTDQYPFVCEVCGKMCGEKNLLKIHMQSHSDVKAHQCSYCGKSFAHSSTLHAHVRLHTGSKPFVCQVCGHSFAQVSSLNYHKLTHTGEKPYTCHICGNSYTRKTTLTTHLSKHSGTKLVKCTMCDFSCFTAKQRRKHMSVVHNITTGAAKAGRDIVNKDMKVVCEKQEETVVPQDMSTTLQPVTSTVGVQIDLNLNGQISMTSYPCSNTTTAPAAGPIYYNHNQGFVDMAQISHQVQAAQQYSSPPISVTSISLPSSSTTSFIPAPAHNHTTNQQTLSMSSIQSYVPSSFTYLPTSDNTSTSIIDPVSLSMHHLHPLENANGVDFSNKPVPPIPAFCDPLTRLSNSDHHIVPSDTSSPPIQNVPQYTSASSSVSLFSHEKNEVWLTIDASSIPQDQRVFDSNISTTSVSADIDPAPSRVFPADSKDLVQTAMISAQITSTETEMDDNNDDCDDDHTVDDVQLDDCVDVQPSITSNIPPAEVEVKNESQHSCAENQNEMKITDKPTGRNPEVAITNIDIDVTSPVIHESKSVKKVSRGRGRPKSKLQPKVKIKSKTTRARLENIDFTKTKTRKKTVVKKSKKTKIKGYYDTSSDNEEESDMNWFESEQEEKVEFVKRKSGKRKARDSDYEPEVNLSHDKGKKKKLRKSLRVKLMYKRSEIKSKRHEVIPPEVRGRNSSKKYAAKVTKVKVVKKRVKVRVEIEPEETLKDETKTDLSEDEDVDLKVPRKRGHYKKHAKDEIFKCTDCDMVFSRYQYLKKHLTSHKKHESYTCLYCLRVFDKKMAIAEHMHTEHPNQYPFSCNICDFSCIDVASLKNHVKKHHNDIEYRCHICEATFSKSKPLKDHMSKNHEGSQAFVCHTCDKSFAECSLLVLHNKHKHSGVRAFKCNLCDKTLVAAAKLISHLRAHTGERPYTCEFCGKDFAHLSLLNIHIKAHSSVKPYVCNYCGYSFTHKSTLKAHVRTHTGVKPFKCDLCDKSFAQLSSLNYHRKSHDGLKPFTCELCGRSFTRATTLKTHLMQHEGKKRFSCELCDFKCNRKLGMRKHHAKKHSVPEGGDKLVRLGSELEVQDGVDMVPNSTQQDDLNEVKRASIISTAPLKPLPSSSTQLLSLPSQPIPPVVPPPSIAQHIGESSLTSHVSTLTSLLQLPLPPTSTPPQSLEQPLMTQSHPSQQLLHHPHQHHQPPQQSSHHLKDPLPLKSSEDSIVLKETLSIPTPRFPFFYPGHPHHQHHHHQQQQQQHQHQQQHQQQQQLHPLHPTPPPMSAMLGQTPIPPNAHSFIALQSLHHYHHNN